jgi:cytochrome c oxidase cbb3-type subunit 3
MADKREIDEHSQTETTGHEWDGIKELDTPMPRWWLWTFYGTIIWGAIYVILMPAWPLVSQATPGLLGYSSRANVAADIAAAG